jgi:ATP-dependent Clp protease ATP-binding subunit ClpA
MTSSERRYSQHARRSLVWARLLAQEFHHPVVDTDHLLLGIWRTEGSLGYQVLHDFLIDRQKAEEAVRQLHPSLNKPITPPPYSDNLAAVLTYAADEAHWLGHHYIGTEHILLGLVRAGTGQLSLLLLELRVSSHQVRQRIRRLLVEGLYESNLDVRRSARLSELSRRVLNAAAKIADENRHGSAGLEHLLLVLAREHRSLATRMLLEAGINHEQLAEDLRAHQLDSVLAATALDEVLAQAMDQAEKLGTHYTGTDHLLLAMTLDDEAISLLEHYEVNVDYLRGRLQALFNE